MSTPDLVQFSRDVFTASAQVKQAAGEALAEGIVQAARLIAQTYAEGGVVYAFGNGGSAADAQHLVGELIGRYHRDRRPLAAVTLSADPSTVTCIGNDYGYAEIFARQVQGLATSRDTVVGITTSGRSPNVVAGLKAAQAAGARTVALTGGSGGDVVALADVSLVVPSSETPRIQECHTTAIHALSELIEWLVLDLPLPSYG